MDHKKQHKGFKTQYITQFFKINPPNPCSQSSSVASQQNIQTEGNKDESSLEPESIKIEIYTDGSCVNNGKKFATSSYAFQIYFNDQLKYQENKPIIEQKQTNQRAELYAVLYALDYLKNVLSDKIYDANNFITIYSDSEYCIKCITEWSKNWNSNDWKNKKNTDILKHILDYYQKINFTFKHVKSHQTSLDKHSIRNNLVDQLAKDAIPK
jgi:ribonuclease HI